MLFRSFAVARLLPVRESRRELEVRIGEVGSERDRLAEQLSEQEARLAELRTRVQAKLAEEDRSRHAPVASERRVADEEIELELLRRRRTEEAR